MKKYIYLSLLTLLIFACRTTSPASTVAPTAVAGSPAATTAPLEPLPATAVATLAPPVTQPPPPPTVLPPTPTPAPLRFAVIGDFGEGNQGELDVANMIKGWGPDIILTVGDNNYPVGSAETIDDRIGQYYHEYIAPYSGAYGPGAEVNRFFPTLGNHDLDTARGQPYLDYFVLPGNERYYDFTWGPVHFFALNSDSREPDGVAMSSVQAQWLQAGLAASSAPWQIVYFHASPYSTGYQGPVNWMQWPFAEWGADTVMAGHNHVYERLLVDGIPYFTNGLGGGPIYDFTSEDPQVQARYNDNYGAMLVVADPQQVTFSFVTRSGETIDTHTITRSQ